MVTLPHELAWRGWREYDIDDEYDRPPCTAATPWNCTA